MDYIFSRIKDNLKRLNNRKIAIFPYGEQGKIVHNMLVNKFNIEVDYIVDNTNSMKIDEFFDKKVNDTMIIFSTNKTSLFRELLGVLFENGVNSKDILILHKYHLLGIDALEKILNLSFYKTVLDVGCGQGLQARIMADYEKIVTGITISNNIGYNASCIKECGEVIIGDFLEYSFKEKYDVIWISHVLEHIDNIPSFLNKAKELINPGGCLVIVVPARETKIMMTHIHSFNAGRILRYLLFSGIDCRKVRILENGYNLSVIVEDIKFITDVVDSKLIENQSIYSGDADGLLDFLPNEIPINVEWSGIKTFDGNILELNWTEDYKMTPIKL